MQTTHRQPRKLFTTILCLLLTCGFGQVTANGYDVVARSKDYLGDLKQDYRQFYLSPDRLLRLGIAFGVGGIMANSGIDEDIQEWYQDHAAINSENDIANALQRLGEGRNLLPIAAAAALADDIIWPDQGHPVGVWGKRVTRAYLVGTPALLLTQRLTGGAAPYAGEPDWHTWHDDKGVSGHAFIGAVPFLTAGRMFEDNPPARYGLYALSALPALSRVNDNRHYASQAFLGWFLAWQSAGAVLETSTRDRQITLAPMITPEACGLSLCIRW
jgi:membrane-associated phospholipid phosphatase